MFAGGLLGWFVLIPAIVFFGGNSIITPQDIAIHNYQLVKYGAVISDI